MKIEIDLDDEYSEMFEAAVHDVLDPSIFNENAIGHWACNVAQKIDADGYNHWLLFEASETRCQNEKQLIEQFFKGEELKELPEGYFHLGYSEAVKIVIQGFIQNGIIFVNSTPDGDDLSSAIETVLFGEVRYC